MLRFTIIDYTTNPAGDSTVIDEPIGWDGIALRIARHKEWHGFFDFADDSVASLQFVGDGYSILKTAYETTGTSSNVQLLIEYACMVGDAWQQLYIGRFIFSEYKDVCGDVCYVEIKIEAVNCFTMFNNRYDQKVDLDSLQTFDPCKDSIKLTNVYLVFTVANHFLVTGQTISTAIIGQWLTITGTTFNNGTYQITNVTHSGSDSIIECSAHTFVLELGVYGNIASYCLTPYDGLGKQIYLPPKTIQLQSQWLTKEAQTISIEDIPNVSPVTARYAFTPDWANVISEIENTQVGTGVFILGTGTPNETFDKANPPDELIYFTAANGSNLKCIGDMKIDLDFTYSLNHPSVLIDEFRLYIVKDTEFNPPYAGLVNPASGSTMANQAYWDLNATGSHNFVNSINVHIEEGQTIWLFFTIKVEPLFTHLSIDLNFTANSKYTATVATQCSSTVAKVYEVNEVLSRCVEAYTDDCMRVYSEYFGRTDAQPYATGSDGCGGLRAITNGYNIRNAPNTDATTPHLMAVSMKDCFDALNATDNIGMSLENDTIRGGGHKWIRVEPFEYFYNDSVLLTCTGIRELKRSVDASIIYSTFKSGYAKFETWNTNGVFDMYANRNYRTTLSEIKNELDRTCQWIASDYAIEITRRLYGTTTSDWRYDQDIFFLCLFRNQYNYNVTGQFLAPNLLVIGGQGYAIKVGDSIVISGTASNNGTFVVTYINYNAPFSSTQVGFASGITTEGAGAFNITSATAYLEVEQGVNSPENILYPDTVLNYRLAPSRNVMRWFKTILNSYRDYLTGVLKFTSGSGNILAKGETNTPCRIENGIIQEKEDIDLSLFNTPSDSYPFFYPELVIFDYPMSYEDYLIVLANPYGLIGYQCGGNDVSYGWIVDMKYSPYMGSVNFTLRPKI
jgi:hypothetical protein